MPNPFFFQAVVAPVCQHALLSGDTPPLVYCGNIELNMDAKSDFVNTIFWVIFFPFSQMIYSERVHTLIIEKFQIYITMISYVCPLHYTVFVWIIEFYV